MAKYELHVDRKQTVWHREWFQVDADSLEEAVEQCLDYKIDPYYSGEMYNTVEEMTPEENGNCATVEVYSSDGNLVYSNDLSSYKSSSTI